MLLYIWPILNILFYKFNPPPILFYPNSYILFDMDRGIPNQNKSPNYRYIKLDITCNIEAGESGTACNITPIPVSCV